MSTDIPQDPLEGEGEEMIPDKGLPFDDIDDTPLEDIPPEERIPDFEEEDVTFDDEQHLLMETEETVESEETSAEETSAFELSDEEAEALIGDVGEAFTPTDAFDEVPSEERGLSGPPEEAPLIDEFIRPPEDFTDEGMGTHKEELPMETEHFHEPLFSEAAHQPPGPATPAKVHTHDDMKHAEQPAEQPMVDLLISDDDVQSLWRRADQAQKDVNRYISTIYIAHPMLDQIQAARNELMAGRENYEDAERHLGEVEYRVQLSIQLEKWSKTIIPKLFIYLAVWFIISIAAIFLVGESIFNSDAPRLIFLAGSMIWGSIGGIVGALLPLIKHYSDEQDFDKRHNWWYITSPFVGVAMGAIIFLFMSAGILSITGGADNISSPIIVYIISGLAGYQHNVFTDLVKRMLKVLQIEKKEDTKPPKTGNKKIEES